VARNLEARPGANKRTMKHDGTGSESRGSPTPQSDRTAPYYRTQAVSSSSHSIQWELVSPLLCCCSCCFAVAVAVTVAIAVDVDVDVVSINLIDSTKEPIFAEFASKTVTAELRRELDSAIAAILPAHHLNPTICSSWTAAG